MPQRKEGFVVVALMALSTAVMLTIVSAICIVGSQHYKFYHEQEVLAESQRIEVEEAEHDAMMLSVLV